MNTVNVAGRFYCDYIDRSDNQAELLAAIVSSTKTTFVVNLTDEQLNALYADASYYAEGADYGYLRGLVSSARATVKSLDEVLS